MNELQITDYVFWQFRVLQLVVIGRHSMPLVTLLIMGIPQATTVYVRIKFHQK